MTGALKYDLFKAKSGNNSHLAHGNWSNKQQALRDRPILVPVAVIVVSTALFLVYEIRFGRECRQATLPNPEGLARSMPERGLNRWYAVEMIGSSAPLAPVGMRSRASGAAVAGFFLPEDLALCSAFLCTSARIAAWCTG